MFILIACYLLNKDWRVYEMEFHFRILSSVIDISMMSKLNISNFQRVFQNRF